MQVIQESNNEANANFDSKLTDAQKPRASSVASAEINQIVDEES